MTMIIGHLISGIHSTIPILQKIADGQPLSFDEAWSLVTIYKRYKDPDAFVDYVEDTPRSEYPKLRDDVAALAKETSAILNIYYGAKEQFRDFETTGILEEHLRPSYTAYRQAQEESVKAYDDFKPIQNSMDSPELHYSKEEIPHMWEVYNAKKEYSDRCSKRTKELFEVYDRERRRTSGLFKFRVSSIIMLVYSLDEMSKALLADLDDIVGKEVKG